MISYDREGVAQRIVGTNIDVTQRKQTEVALAESEVRLADALTAGQVIAFEWNAVTGQSRRSANAAAILGPEPSVADGAHNDFFSRVHPDDRDGFRAQIRQLRPDHPGYAWCFRFRCRDGREVWLEETARGEFDTTGKLVRVKGLTRDVSERQKAERALAERTLQLALAGKAALVGSYSYDIHTDTLQISEGYAALYGLPEGTTEITRAEWRAITHIEDVERVEELRQRAFRERRGEYEIEYRIVRSDAEVRWIESRSFMAYAPDGSPQQVVGVNIDVTERKQAEEHRNILNAELDHRVKNVLATVGAIIRHTQHSTPSMADFVTALEQRIELLAGTHELLSHHNWRGVSLADVVQREFAPYAGDNAEISGPAVFLKAEATQAVAMVLHELTTNSAKYGAFSSQDGRVLLRWRWPQLGACDRLIVDWQEIGGPALACPPRSGYGSSIIRELIPFELGGAVDLDFGLQGLRCRLEIPADWVSPGPLAGPRAPRRRAALAISHDTTATLPGHSKIFADASCTGARLRAVDDVAHPPGAATASNPRPTRLREQRRGNLSTIATQPDVADPHRRSVVAFGELRNRERQQTFFVERLRGLAGCPCRLGEVGIACRETLRLRSRFT